MNKIFNAAVFMPGELIARVQKMSIRLAWSNHAKQALLDDRYGVLPPGSAPLHFKGRDWQLVEAETSQRFNAVSLDKIVVRRPVDATRSLVLVILCDDDLTGLVKTAFLNLNDDTHKTLDRSRLTENLS